MSRREKYEQGFWPLAALPILLVVVATVVVLHASALAVGALAALAAPVALTEVLVWRALEAKWAGDLDSLWPWSSRLRSVLELLVLYAAVVAAGTPKAHSINGGTWPGAVLFSAFIFGGLGTFYLLLWLVERAGGRLR
jgi:hypothetical protein